MTIGQHFIKMNHLEPESLNAVFRRLGIDADLPYEDKLREARRILGQMMRPEGANGAQVHRSRKHAATSSRTKSRKSHDKSKSGKSKSGASASKSSKRQHVNRRHSGVYERDASRRRKYSPVSRKRVMKKMANVTQSKSATLSSSASKSSVPSKITTVSKLPAKFNQKSFIDAAQKLATQGFTQVVSALQNKKGGNDKVWLMLRKPGSVKTGGRVTLWGNSEHPNRHTYGGSIEKDSDLIASKLKNGYVKNAALKRMAANVIRKTQNAKK